MSTEEREVKAPEVVENELSTGLIIAGAYADKLRRTLFAQLKDYVKQDKELAREIARAAGEINRLLYHILVENLKSDKGDVVRIRVKYRFDPRERRVRWDYDTLYVEFFKRQPDDQVNAIVENVIKEKLREIMELYATPQAAEEAERAFKEAVKPPEEVAVVEKPVEAPKPVSAEVVEETLAQILGSADPIGETASGGVVFKIADKRGNNIGLASVEPRAGGWVIDAVIIYERKAFRAYLKASRDRDFYINNPDELISELAKARPIPISAEDAKKLIQGKMAEVV